MEKRTNGTRYIKYKTWNRVKNEPYDYANDGLLNKILSNKIVNTNNTALKIILEYYEKSLVFLMKYVDTLKNFKNYHWKNR
jgi:hypothetical protein